MTIRKIANLFNSTVDKKTDLVGISVDSDLLDGTMAVNPRVVFEPHNGHGTLMLSFSPVGDDEYGQLNELGELVHDTDSGYVPVLPILPDDLGDDVNVHKIGAFVQRDIRIGLYTEQEYLASTDVQEFTMNKTKHYLATVSFNYGKEEAKLTVKMLFRDFVDDSRNFFAGLIGVKLSKPTISKVLELVANKLVGVPIAYATSATLAMSASILPVTGGLRAKAVDGRFTVSNDSGMLSFNLEQLGHAEIIHTTDDDYVITLKGKNNVMITTLHH